MSRKKYRRVRRYGGIWYGAQCWATAIIFYLHYHG